MQASLFYSFRMSLRLALAAVLMLGLPPLPARAQSPDELLAAASALIDAKKPTEAAVKLEQFLTAAPKHAKAGVAALALGRCYTEVKQYPKAMAAYDKAIAAKDTTVLTSAQLGLGEAAMQARSYERAAPALEAALKGMLKPEQASIAWYWLGQARFELKKFAEAEQAYLRLTQDFPRSDLIDAAYFGAGLTALRLNHPDLARQRLRLVVDRFPKSPDRPQALLILAQMDRDAKRNTLARIGFEAVLDDPAAKSDPELVRAAEDGLIGALLDLQEFTAAAERLQRLLATLTPTDTRRFQAQLSLGHCRYRQKDYEPALTAYKDAGRSTEGIVAGEAHYWAGNTALALKRPTEAATLFQMLIRRFPKHDLAPRAQLRTADALTEAKQSEAATTAYRAVVDTYPQSPEASEARKALGQLVDSVTDPAQLAAALKTAPPAEKARGTVRLARLYLNAKKYNEAALALQDLLKSKPDAPVAAEGSYLLGLSLEAQDKPVPAVAALADAVRGGGGAQWLADAHARLAWLYLDQKDAAAAEKSATASLALSGPIEIRRNARLALVQALLDQEKWDPALAESKKLLEGQYPPELAAVVLYTQAWTTEKRGTLEESLPLWERLAAEHPKAQQAELALLKIGDARFKAEKFDDARQKYAALLTNSPQSDLAPEARFKLGSALYNLDKHLEAVAEWDKVAADKNAGDYIPEALYWAGVGLDKAGKKPDAITRLTRLVTQFPKHTRVPNAKIRLAALKAVT